MTERSTQDSRTSGRKQAERTAAVSIFRYLHDLSRLRSVPVRDYRNYERYFWLESLRGKAGCDARCFRAVATSHDTQADTSDDNTWFVVRKQTEPPAPALPSTLRPWVAPDTGRDFATPPRLLNKIVVRKPTNAGPDRSPELAPGTDTKAPPRSPTLEYEHLDDHPEVTTALAEFLAAQWTPWANKHAAWSAFQEKVYSPLFAIHRDLARLGEEFELILGVGCLTWRTPNAQEIRRHIVTAQVTLEFDPAAGTFTLRAAPEGAKLGLETDMLDPSEQPSGPQRTAIEDDISSTDDDPWDFAAVDRALRGFAQALSKDGEYDEAAYEPTGIDRSPKVTFAPALLLRRRTSRGVLLALEEVIRQIKDGAELPPGVARLTSAAQATPTEAETAERVERVPAAVSKHTYFPLAANDDQRQIVARLEERNGVLVQGPPGTGKSHTIANLICHLLATGQRVLITAQTPRALQVLREKLPEEIRPLCLSVLGNDKAAQDNVEHSVRHITDQADSWNESLVSEQIRKSEAELDQLTNRAAVLERETRTYREAEVHTHTVGEGAYVGTAQTIAQQVERDAATYAWFEDKPEPNAHFPVDPEAVLELRRELLIWSPARAAALGLKRPSRTVHVPDDGTLVDRVAKWRSFTNRINAAQASAPSLSEVHLDHVTNAAQALRTLQERLAAMPPVTAPWEASARIDVLRGAATGWHALLSRTRERLASLGKLMALVGRCIVTLPPNTREDVLRADIADLISHFQKGGGWGFAMFRVKVVKRTMYVRTSVTIDGRAPESIALLTSMQSWLDLQAELRAAWAAWEGKATPGSRDPVLQLDQLQNLCDRLTGVLAMQGVADHAMQSVAKLRLSAMPALDDAAAVRTVMDICTIEMARRLQRAAAHDLDTWVSTLRSAAAASQMHPVCTRLADAMEKRDPTALDAALAEIRTLEEDAVSLQQFEDRRKLLIQALPRLVASLSATASDPAWDQRLPQVRSAWRWAQADAWLAKFTDSKRAALAEADLVQVQSRTKALLQRAATAHAWHSCLSSMSDAQQQHLTAWRQAVKKLGKGTGKQAGYWRRVAQAELEKCREAIPAWVLPLYRVFETVKPGPGIFDVVIVDEASQCGPESLLLFYLAKKIIIVGDDKQISPTNIGIDKDHAKSLLSQHLEGLDLAETFDVDSSLFDHGKVRLGKRLTLREHFRCMPEIIRFSNDLCYNGTLVPLRQYPPNRLAPFVARYIKDGSREGGKTTAKNEAEAEAIVRTIAACCADPMYKGKTMGVISLLGENQAKLIERLLLKRIGAEEIERRRIVCGDAYSFQGDERHVIFLSLVISVRDEDDRGFAALTKESDMQRFNVAASRAQDQLWLFHSVMPEDVGNPECMRHKLLTYFYDPAKHAATGAGVDVDDLRRKASAANRPDTAPAPFDSWFEVDVYLRIAARGYRVLPQYKAGRKRIDLVVEGRTRLAVECDGDRFHTDENFEEDMARQRQLERVGLQFWRVRGSAFYRDPDAALASLWQRLSDLGIEPMPAIDGSGSSDGYVPTVPN